MASQLSTSYIYHNLILTLVLMLTSNGRIKPQTQKSIFMVEKYF